MKSKKIDLNEEEGNIWIIFSVILAVLFVVAALIMTNDNRPSKRPANNIANFQPNIDRNIEPDPSRMPSITESDYMIGNINAPIQIVEYSDMECPFCSRLHETLHQITETFPNEVVWAYRHLPIANIHPKAVIQATATECAAEQNGNDGYWAMLDSIYRNTPGGNRFDLSKLQDFAAEQELNMEDFNQCLGSGRYDEKIAQQINDGFESGAQGTPYSIVITPNGERIPVSGAQPLEYWTLLIQQIIENEINESDSELINI